MKRVLTLSTESRCVIGLENTLCRRIRASFSPEISQAGAVKGLNMMELLDLDSLTEEERTIILNVIRRDDELRRRQENRVRLELLFF